MKHIVSANWLFEHGTDDSVVIADCRFQLGNGGAGRASYDEDHIPGAVYLDLEKDLSGPLAAHGGRHPLPNIEELADKLGRAGIDGSKTVVAYDDQGGAMASRLWWLLRYLGHDKVYVLDGGYAVWKDKGYPVTDEPAAPAETVFKPNVRADMVVSVEQVKERMNRPGTVLVDSREQKRYLGEEEPIDPVAGHIPGAKNMFWKEALNEAGLWKDSDALASRFGGLSDAEEIIVYCGSGVTACPNVLAMDEAGLRNVKLYAGSWSDWVSYKDNPVATGAE